MHTFPDTDPRPDDQAAVGLQSGPMEPTNDSSAGLWVRQRRLLPWALLAGALAAVAVHHLAGDPRQLDLLFNSDAALMPVMVRDVLRRGGRFGNWYLSPAPCLFPDYPLFLLPFALVGSAALQMGLYSLLQVSAVFAAIGHLARRARVREPLLLAGIATLGLVWLAIRGPVTMSLLLVGIFHYGTLLSAFVVLGLWIGVLDATSNRRRVLTAVLAALSFAGALSDNMFLVQVLAPLAVTAGVALLLDRGSLTTRLRSAALPIAVMTGAAAIGNRAYLLVVPHPTRYPVRLDISTLVINLKDAVKQQLSEMTGTPVFGLIVLAYIGVVLHALFRWRRLATGQRPLLLVVVFSVLAIASNVIAVVLSANVAITGRYFLSQRTWPVVLVVLYLGAQSGRPSRRAAIAMLGCAALAAGSLAWSAQTLIRRNGLDAGGRPSEIACIDSVLARGGLTHGIAGYWDAKHIMVLSHREMTIAPYTAALDPFPWSTSAAWFRPTYDFAIASHVFADGLAITEATLGGLPRPVSVHRCGPRSVYVYGRGGLDARLFARAQALPSS